MSHFGGDDIGHADPAFQRIEYQCASSKMTASSDQDNQTFAPSTGTAAFP